MMGFSTLPRRRALILRGPLAIGAFCLALGVLMIVSGEPTVIVIGILLALGGAVTALNLPALQAARAAQEEDEKSWLRDSSRWPSEDDALGVFIILHAIRYGMDETVDAIQSTNSQNRAVCVLRKTMEQGLHRSIEDEDAKGASIAEPLLRRLDKCGDSPISRLIQAVFAERERLPEDERDLHIPTIWSIDGLKTLASPNFAEGNILLKYAIKHGVDETARAIRKIHAEDKAVESILLASRLTVDSLEAKYGPVVQPLLMQLDDKRSDEPQQKRMRFTCPRCGRHLSTIEQNAGTEGVCPKCNRPIRAPSVSVDDA